MKLSQLHLCLIIILLLILPCYSQVLEWEGYRVWFTDNGTPSNPLIVVQPTSSYNFQILDGNYQTVANFSLPIPANASYYSIVGTSSDFDTDANIEVLYWYQDTTTYTYSTYLRDITTSTNQLSFSDPDTSYLAWTRYHGNERIIIISGIYSAHYHTYLYRSNNPQEIGELKDWQNLHESMGSFYPVPSRKNVYIKYHVPSRENVKIKIYDAAGKEVSTLLNKSQDPGDYSIKWNGKDANNLDLPAGNYFCRIRLGNDHLTEKVILLE
jgi:hypothetical protein